MYSEKQAEAIRKARRMAEINYSRERRRIRAAIEDKKIELMNKGTIK